MFGTQTIVSRSSRADAPTFSSCTQGSRALIAEASPGGADTSCRRRCWTASWRHSRAGVGRARPTVTSRTLHKKSSTRSRAASHDRRHQALTLRARRGRDAYRPHRAIQAASFVALFCVTWVGVATGMQPRAAVKAFRTAWERARVIASYSTGNDARKTDGRIGATTADRHNMIDCSANGASTGRMFVAFIIGIPVFFRWIVLLIRWSLRSRGAPALRCKDCISLVAGLSGPRMLPPHPAAMLA